MPIRCCLLFVFLFIGMCLAAQLPAVPQKDKPDTEWRLKTGFHQPEQPQSVQWAALISRQNNSFCRDTSTRILFHSDSADISTSWLTPTADGNFLSAGGYSGYVPSLYSYGGWLVKFTPQGDTIWTRRIVAGYGDHLFGLYRTLELQNKDILVLGTMAMIVPYNGTTELFMARLTPDGRHLWHRTFKYKRYTDTTSGDFSITDIKESSAGDLYLTGAYLYTAPAKGLLTMKFSSAGDFLWSTDIYTNGGFPKGVGADVVGNEVRLFGTGTFNSFIYNATNTIIIARLNALNGDTLSVKSWGVPLDSGSLFRTVGGLAFLTRLTNGNYVVSGQASGDTYASSNPVNTFHYAAVEFDNNLQPLTGYSVQSDFETNGFRFTVFPNGDAAYLQKKYISGYSSDMVTGYIQNRQIIRERYMRYHGLSTAGTNFLRLPDGGTLAARQNYDSATKKSDFEIMKMHNSDTGSGCFGFDTAANRIVPMPAMIPYPTYFINIFRNLVEATARPFGGIVDGGLTRTDNCNQINYCDSLTLAASDTVLCPSGTLQLVIRKNKQCGTRPAWDYEAANIKQFKYTTDSTVQVEFEGNWDGYFVAEINGCRLLRDSVHVRVLSIPAPLSLGPDRRLCPGNTIVLNAHKGYASYLWQDGSIDSIYIVTQPGLYYVTTTDACGGSYKDSVTITASPPIPFNVGPDRTKCNGDTLRLSAPSGFLNYTWSNNYNISSLTLPDVVVNPLVDTAYYIKAEKTAGCFAYDTVRIKVYHSPPIQLGNDKNFCFGDSAVLDAGSGFQTYQWSGGQTTQTASIKTVGQHSVIGTTVQGCRSYDTVKVLSVYPLPVVRLDSTAALCFGESKTLNAGSFSSYAWNTGETTAVIRVTAIGRYAVTVTDANGCKGGDTTAITIINPQPAGFLPADTAVCSYGTVTLKPIPPFNRYLWSTGETTPLLTVSKPGLYWLEVIDANACKGRDTVLVNPKECAKGFYVPSAFSPNGDGKNDAFYPLLFGTVKDYRFTVYNRWGQVVFQTSELQKGWDGRVGGILQRSDVFVWTCAYQFEGEGKMTDKGTVTLIR